MVDTPVRRDGIAFRPGLDGARAIAVTAVMLYHAGVPGTAGGYLGVDLFFVLSGFLITSLLLVEYRDTGRVSLVRFWWRRARRLLPALFAVLLFVSWFALTRAPDVLHARLRGDQLSTLFYVANWRFILDEVSYFERFADPNPLLHMWSLAIEEQFYLVWPLLLLALLGPIRRRFGRRTLVVAIVALGLGSALWMALLQAHGASVSRLYYGTDTRAFALLTGAFIARWAVNRRWWDVPSGARLGQPAWLQSLGWVGLIGLLVAFVTLDEESPMLYHGGFVLVALLAACFLLPISHPGVTPLGRLLSSAPLRWVGDRSYGLYLWHWPVYVLLSGPRTGLEGLPLLALRLAATVLVAALSHRFIEVPWRRGRLSAIPTSGVALAAVRRLLPAIVVVAVVIVATTVPRPAPPPAAVVQDPGPGGPSLSVLMYGDSVAYGLHNQHRPDPRLNLRVSGSTRLGCLTMVGGRVMVDGKVQDQPSFCADWPDQFRRAASTRHDLAIVMLGNGELFDHSVDGTVVRYGTPEYRDHLTSWLDSTFASLRPTSGRVAMTTVPCYSRPDFGVDVKDKIVNEPGRARWLNDFIRQYAALHPGIEVFDWAPAICPGGEFHRVVDGVDLREDGVHFTADGATWAWRWLATAIRTTS